MYKSKRQSNTPNIRIMPCLLMQDNKLVKTVKYKSPSYIGDPLNAIRIYNELFVDEIILIDIRHTRSNTQIDFEYLKVLASECFIPMCYGGGITSIEEASRLFSIGFEKLCINAAATKNTKFIKSLSSHFGSQSIVCAIDCYKSFVSNYKIYVHNKKRLKISIIDYALLLEENGAGELLINAIHKDGLMTGYDLDLLLMLNEKITIPIIANSGAGNLLHMKLVFDKTGINAFAAGSMFVYSGNLKGVLISYPSRDEIRNTFFGKDV